MVSCERQSNYWLLRSPKNSWVKTIVPFFYFIPFLLNMNKCSLDFSDAISLGVNSLNIQQKWHGNIFVLFCTLFIWIEFASDSHEINKFYRKSHWMRSQLFSGCQLFYQEEITWIYSMFIKYWYVRYVVLPSNVPNLFYLHNQNRKKIKLGVKTN